MTDIHVDDPQEGYFLGRLVKSGQLLPSRIWLRDGERDPDTGELVSDQTLHCTIGDEECDANREWPYLARYPITKEEYDAKMRVLRWADGTTAPEGSPNRPVDLLRSPSVF